MSISYVEERNVRASFYGVALSELVGPDNLDEPLISGMDSIRSAEYRSAFEKWYKRASVRVKPRRMLAEQGADAVYFPPELVPVTRHRLVTDLGPIALNRLLIHRLLHYLHFTTELEQIAVIPITTRISRGRAGLYLPGKMREDAFKITTDEAWHAQFSNDLLCQVSGETGVIPRLPEAPQFAGRIDRIKRSSNPDLRDLQELIFAVVSETLISSILSDLPHDCRLPTAVRELVADHAEDEGRHHAYFSKFLEFIWPTLSRNERQRIGPRLPEMIFAFLEPDYRALACALLEIGLSISAVEQIIAESYPQDVVVNDIAKAAVSTIRYFRNIGAFDNQGTRDAFLASGLIERTSD